MDLVTILPYAQLVFGTLSVIFILLQRTESGLGGAFGGSDSFSDSSKYSRRGGEKVMFVLTVVLVALFVMSVFATLFV